MIAETKVLPSVSGETHRGWVSLMAAAVLIAVVALIALQAYWQFGPPDDVDTVMAVYRVFELDQAWRSGIFFPRLGANLNFTYGAPLFQFYPPLSTYVALLFHWLGFGWVEAAKAGATLAIFMGGFGAYLYARFLFCRPQAALVSGLAYLLAPYILVTVIDRGALAETASLALIPWLFWALHHLLHSGEKRWMPVSAALVALLVLAHNITALFMVPLLCLYFFILAWHTNTYRRLPILGTAVILGLALSAFYWAPALMERKYSQVESHLLQGLYSVEGHLTSGPEIVQDTFTFRYWGSPNRRLALWQVLLAALGMVSIPFQPRRLRLLLALLAAGVLGAVILQLEISAFFWSSVPLVAFIEFPWRLLGLICFPLAVLAGAWLELVDLSTVFKWLVALGALALILVGSLAGIAPPPVDDSPNVTSAEIDKEHMFELGRSFFPLFRDFLSTSVTVPTDLLAIPRVDHRDVLQPIAETPSLQVVEETANRVSIQVHAVAPFTIRLHRSYFPGWQVYVSGRPVATRAEGVAGLVTADLPAGDYSLLIAFEATTLRRMACLLSGGAFVVLCVLMLVFARSRRFVVAWIVFMIILAAFGLSRVEPEQTPRRPVPYPASFGDELQLLGHHLPSGPWRSGETSTVRLYWLATQTPNDNYRVFLHLVTEDDTSKVAQADSEPILGYSPTTRWDPGELVVDEQRIHISEDVPPGSYLLLAGLYRIEPLQNLPVSGALETLPGDRVILGHIQVVDSG